MRRTRVPSVSSARALGAFAMSVAVLALGWPGVAESASSPARGEPPIPAVPLSIAVTREVTDGGVAPVQDDAWIAAQLEEASRLFGGYGMRFVTAESRPLPPAQAHAESRRDRDAFAVLLHPGMVNVFVVASLRDVDDPSRMRMGVCWSPRGDSVVRYVILSAIAKPSVLAHELGHYFGNPHSKVPNNVMSYERTPGTPPFFDDVQGRILARTAREDFRRGILRALPEPPAGTAP